MSLKRSALGRGLDSLISMDDIQTSGSSAINEIPIDQISPNPEQPAPTPTPVPPAPAVPQTGDMTWLWIGLGVVAALSAGGLLLIFKRSGTHDEDEES